MPPEISLDNVEDQTEPTPSTGAAGTQPPPPSAPEPEAEEGAKDEPAPEAAPVAEPKGPDTKNLICGMTRAQWKAHNWRMTKIAEVARLEELARRHPEVKALIEERERLAAELAKLKSQ